MMVLTKKNKTNIFITFSLKQTPNPIFTRWLYHQYRQRSVLSIVISSSPLPLSITEYTAVFPIVPGTVWVLRLKDILPDLSTFCPCPQLLIIYLQVKTSFTAL